MEDGFEWKCGKCGKKFTSEQFLKLPTQKTVEADTKPKEEHGFVSVCDYCGYVFHKDKWFIKDKFYIYSKDTKMKLAEVSVSTVDLELNHFGCWYETMVFVERSFLDNQVECNYQRRYPTQADAEKGHQIIIDLLRNSEFEVLPKTYEIKVRE